MFLGGEEDVAVVSVTGDGDSALQVMQAERR